jgi:enoyl-CoA hydratase/carnithine racemase
MSSVHVESGAVAQLHLNRPEKLNAIDRPLAAGLRDALETLDADDAVHAAVLSGAGRAFCVGADLNAVEDADAGAHRAWVEELGGLYERLRAARALGLANEAVPMASVAKRANELAASFSTGSPSALCMTKRLFYDTLGLPHGQQVAAGRDAVLAARGTDDAREGAAAFRERRPPRRAS